jgi:hypothetical protein
MDVSVHLEEHADGEPTWLSLAGLMTMDGRFWVPAEAARGVEFLY